MDVLTTLDAEVYLFDPPETIWDRVLLLDHGTWFEHKDMEVLQQAVERTSAVSRDIPREAWMGLYASANPLKPVPPQGMTILHSLFKRAEELPEWERLRMMVGMDPIAAAFGSAHFVADLMDRLPTEVKEAMESAQQDRDRVQDLENHLQIAQSLASGGGQGDKLPEGGEGTSITREQLEEMIRQLETDLVDAKNKDARSEQAVLDTLDGAQARLNQSFAEAMDQSTDDIANLQTVAEELGVGWGLGSSRNIARERVAGLHEISKYLRKSPSLKLILESLGWAKSLVSHERRKSTRGRQSFTHYKIQDLDLETLSPDELVSMIAFEPSSPIYLDFLCRALDGDLLHAQFEGEDYAGRGPIVFLRDESGSMRGRRRATACALELALMLEARKEDRRFISIPFSDIGQFDVYDPGLKPDPIALMDHLELTYGDGTEPYGPLTAAIELIRDDALMKTGDILCITDGRFGQPPDEFLQLLEEAREEPGLKLVAVVINGHPGQADFADKVVMIGDIVRERERLAEAISPIL